MSLDQIDISDYPSWVTRKPRKQIAAQDRMA
jgi:hypothetical protein